MSVRANVLHIPAILHICCLLVVAPCQSFLEATFDEWHTLCRNLCRTHFMHVSVRVNTCVLGYMYRYGCHALFSVKVLLGFKMLLFKKTLFGK